MKNMATWRLIWPYLRGVLIVLAVLIAVWFFANWIYENAALLMVVGTWITGAALAIFAWRTHKLSAQVAEFQYDPVLEVRPVYDLPEKIEDERVVDRQFWRYSGVQWEVCLINPGNAPVWVDRIEIGIRPTSGIRQPCSTINEFCDLLDKEGNPVKPRIAIRASSELNITILVWDKNIKELVKLKYQDEGEFVMRVRLFQTRRLGKSVRDLNTTSREFSLPEKFGKELAMRGEL